MQNKGIATQTMTRKSFLGAAAAAGLGLALGGKTTMAWAEKDSQVAFTPGTYRKEGTGHNAPVVVEVTFSENGIDAIEVVEHHESKSLGTWGMEQVIDKILANQTVAVDAVAGATISSNAVIAAVKDAVKEAGVALEDFSAPVPDDSVAPEDQTVDVVVVGAGSAGLAAAYEAHELGLNVVLIEQLGIVGGSSARFGCLIVGNTKLNGLTDGDKILCDYLVNNVSPNLDPSLVDEEYCREMTARSGELVDFLYDMGVEFGEPSNNIANAPLAHWGKDGTRIGWSIVAHLRDYLLENGVDVRVNTRGERLVTDADGNVTGIVCTSPQGTEYTLSAKGVVLATCGYFANKELTARFNPGFEKNSFDVSIGADGSGILMAEEVGGVPTLMDNCGCHGLSSTYLGASRSLTIPAGNGCIAVNGEGSRFTDEAGAYVDLTTAVMGQESVFCIMDQEMMDRPLIKEDVGCSGTIEMYEVADTLEELAEKLGITDPDNFVANVERYGEFVRNGVDEDFGKRTFSLTTDFTTPPYYGVKCQVENHTVYGGILTDNDSRVLREDGSPIDGLYAAGEVALFKTGGTIPAPTCMDMGMQAVRHIATL